VEELREGLVEEVMLQATPIIRKIVLNPEVLLYYYFTKEKSFKET